MTPCPKKTRPILFREIVSRPESQSIGKVCALKQLWRTLLYPTRSFNFLKHVTFYHILIVFFARLSFQRGKIPLLLAVEAGNQSMCRELLAQQATEQLKATTPAGDSALHLAARRRDVDMVRILVDYGTSVDTQNVSKSSFFFTLQKILTKFII